MCLNWSYTFCFEDIPVLACPVWMSKLRFIIVPVATIVSSHSSCDNINTRFMHVFQSKLLFGGKKKKRVEVRTV